jgi:hypothetical protein
VTKKPRIQVILNPATLSSVRRAASIQGRSMGSLVGELVDAAVPYMDRASELIERATKAPESLLDALRGDLARGEHAARSALEVGLTALDDAERKLRSSDAPAAGEPQGSEPPSCNTGVRSNRQRGKTAKEGGVQ